MSGNHSQENHAKIRAFSKWMAELTGNLSCVICGLQFPNSIVNLKARLYPPLFLTPGLKVHLLVSHRHTVLFLCGHRTNAPNLRPLAIAKGLLTTSLAAIEEFVLLQGLPADDEVIHHSPQVDRPLQADLRWTMKGVWAQTVAMLYVAVDT